MKIMKKKESEWLEEDFLKELEELEQFEEKLNKKKKHHIDKDVFAILGFLGALLLLAVSFAFFGTKKENPEVSNFLQNSVPKETDSSQAKVIMTCAFIGVFLVTLFIIKKLRDAKRETQKKLERLAKLRQSQELQRARERVQNARAAASLNAGKSEMERRRHDGEFLKNAGGRMGGSGYVRRDLNLYKDDDYEEAAATRSKSGSKKQTEGLFPYLIRKFKELFQKK